MAFVVGPKPRARATVRSSSGVWPVFVSIASRYAWNDILIILSHRPRVAAGEPGTTTWGGRSRTKTTGGAVTHRPHERRPPPHRWARGRSLSSWRSAQELQDALRGLVGLGEHGGAGLGEDLGAGEGHHLQGHVGVPDPGLRRGQVLDRHVQVGDLVLEAVLGGTEPGPGAGHR